MIPLHEGFYNKLDYRSSTEDIIEENRSDSYASDYSYQNEPGKNTIVHFRWVSSEVPHTFVLTLRCVIFIKSKGWR